MRLTCPAQCEPNSPPAAIDVRERTRTSYNDGRGERLQRILFDFADCFANARARVTPYTHEPTPMTATTPLRFTFRQPGVKCERPESKHPLTMRNNTHIARKTRQFLDKHPWRYTAHGSLSNDPAADRSVECSCMLGLIGTTLAR